MRDSPSVGMVGAGQLARMTHQAAISLNIDLVVLAASPDDPAVTAGARHVIGSPRSTKDLQRLGKASCNLITFDHELVPTKALQELEASGCQLRPSASAFALAQDKLNALERISSMKGIEILVPPFSLIHEAKDLLAFAEQFGWPVVAKARQGGYDGRGVAILEGPEEARALFEGSPGVEWIAEAFVEIETEIAVQVARSPSGQIATYEPVETLQKDGICIEVVSPARIPDALAQRARRAAGAIFEETGATGICVIEIFLDKQGNLVFNEVALRPHNSGHLTIEAAATSQFEQHLRAVLDWPLGSTELVSPAAMVNLIAPGDTVDISQGLLRSLEVPGACLHLYAKAPRKGRKIGHVTVLDPDLNEALAKARDACARFWKDH
jgi:5-(carboxyamino)imidazole ribonucleotide synthase